MQFNRAALFAALATAAAFVTGSASAAVGAGGYPSKNPRALSARGHAFIKQEEGFRASAYPDGRNAAGLQLYSIGYGHQITGKDGLTKDSVITPERGDALFSQDVASREKLLNSLVRVPITQGQYDAMLSLIYNIGNGAFQSSTLLKKLNAGDYAGARAQFSVWTKNGTQNVGRRQREANLFAT